MTLTGQPAGDLGARDRVAGAPRPDRGAGDVVPEHEVKAWVSGFGVPVPRGVVALSPDEVPTAAAALRPPLVVKAFWPGLVHKSDVGAVRLGCASAAEAGAVADCLAAELGARGLRPAGYLVEEQAAAGVELIVGALRDPTFGPVVLLGLGGIWAEALDDTVLRIAPIDAADAEAMLAGLRGRAVLDGGRGRPAVDRAALVQLLLAVAGEGGVLDSLGAALGEFELNPVIAGPDGVTAVDARLLAAPPSAGSKPAGTPEPRPEVPATDFGRLLAPRGVAVVGASAKTPNFGNMFLGYYRASGFAGTLVAVHPTATEIDGVPAVPSLAEVPDTVDYALVAVPAERCADAVAAARGPSFVQVMSGGFSETGAAGLEAGLAAAARAAGVRLLGPNCMGVYSPAGGQTFLGGTAGRPGRIAVLTQSGGVAGEVIAVGERRGLSFRAVVTLGNSIDVTAAELLRYLAGDPETSAVGLYLENPRDGRGLLDALRGPLPVVALVGGRSRQGARAAASHTGALVAGEAVWRALAAQTGVELVTSQDDLLNVLDFVDLHGGRCAPPGPDVLLVGPSGGAGVLAADCVDAAGLRLCTVPDGVRDALRALGLGAGTSLANPLEVTVGPRARPGLVREVVSTILAATPCPDVIAHVNAQSFVTFGDDLAPLLAYVRSTVAVQAEHDTRLTLVLRNTECAPQSLEDEAREIARAAGVPVYRTFAAAATAIAAGKRLAARRASAT